MVIAGEDLFFVQEYKLDFLTDMCKSVSEIGNLKVIFEVFMVLKIHVMV